MKSIRRGIPDNFRGTLVLAAGSAAGQIIFAIAAPFLTRLYGAQDFGSLAIYTSVLGCLLVVSSLRYDLAILLPPEDDSAANLLVVALISVAAVTVGSVVVVSCRWAILPRTLAEQTGATFWLLPISVLGGGCYQALSYWALRYRRYRQIAVTKAAQTSGLSVTQLGLGVAGFQPVGLIVGDSVSRIVGTVSLARFAWSSGAQHFRSITPSSIRRSARRFKNFPLFSSWSALINTAGTQLPFLLLGAYYDTTVLGTYALTDRVLAAPSALISQNISSVYAAELAKTLARAPSAARRLFLRHAKYLAIPGIAFGLALALLAPACFRIIFGSPWEESGWYARLLAIPQAVTFIVWPMTLTLTMLEKQRVQLYWDVLRLISTTGALVASGLFRLPPRLAVLNYGIALSVCYLLHFFLCNHYLGKLSAQTNEHGLDLHPRDGPAASPCKPR